MSRQTESQPTGVSCGTKQAGEAEAWSWVEPSVWTDRMLAALEEGVKGGVWYSLIDKVYSMGNLRSAFAKVKAKGGAPGVDHQTVEHFESDLEANLTSLHEALKAGTYCPQAIRRTHIPKPGSRETRPLGIPTVRDRVAQAALRHVLEPIFERDFAEASYGFRPGRSCKDALRRVDQLLKAGYGHVVDADLKSYFDTIPHEALLGCVRKKVSDGRVLSLVESYLKQNVMEGLTSWEPEEGSPQGAVISPLLANIYLDALDHEMAEAGYEMVRYADDFVVLCRSAEEADSALSRIRKWTDEAELWLHPEKTQIVDIRESGFDFLGYRFFMTSKCRLTRRPQDKSVRKLKETLRHKTKRTNGRSLSALIADVNRTLRGWYQYFKHSCLPPLRQLDRWIRRRIRTILRYRRRKLPGPSRGIDHKRWPNAYLARQGLFSMERAAATARQPARR